MRSRIASTQIATGYPHVTSLRQARVHQSHPIFFAPYTRRATVFSDSRVRCEVVLECSESLALHWQLSKPDSTRRDVVAAQSPTLKPEHPLPASQAVALDARWLTS